MRPIIWLIAILAGLSATAQEIWSPPPAAGFITRFPFQQFSGGVIVVKASINQLPDTLQFILDTGSGGISLDSTTASQLQLPLSRTDTIITGMGGARKVQFSFNNTLQLPGLSVKALNFHINDYSVLSSVYGQRIDGIIGYSFLSRYIVKVNFDSAFLEVWNPGQINYPKGGTLLHPAFTRLPIIELAVKDRRKSTFDFYLDTGAGLCFLMSDRYAQDSTILHPDRKPIQTQAEGMGGKVQMRQTVVKMVQVGKFKFRNVPTYLFKDDLNVIAYPAIGGLLGNDLMRRFNMTFNYPSKEIHLLPNTHFLDPFDYAYTGFSIYQTGQDIKVEDVVPGGPAEKAGIKVDDVIIAVGNNFSNNIMQYKDLLQSARQKIQVILRRDSQLIQLTIKPISIL